MPENDDIQDVMRDEQGRGKRQPKTAESLRKQRQRIQEMRALMSTLDRQAFMDGLIRLGVQPGTPAFDAALEAWREFAEGEKRGG